MHNPEHPKQLEAAIKREERQRVIQLGKLAHEKWGLSYVVISPNKPHYRGVIFAYTRVKPGLICMSSSVCNYSDHFNVKYGKAVAAIAYDEGHSIFMPHWKFDKPKHFLQGYFL